MKKSLKLLVFFFVRLLGFFTLARFLTRHKLRILCYHGGQLIDEAAYNPKLFCSPSLFRKRMIWLQQNKFTVVSLDNGLRLQEEKLRGREKLPVVITFDDGWHSTVSQLIPILGELKMPSTLYLSTKYYKGEIPILAVCLRYIAWRSRQSSITITGLSREIDGLYDVASIKGKNALVEKAIKWLEHNFTNRADCIDAIERFAYFFGVTAEEIALETKRFDYASRLDLFSAYAKGCVIELHGHEHLYPLGNPSRFRADLVQCRRVIEESGLPTPRHYCYPSGNYDKHASEVLQSLGIISATTCIPGLIGEDSRTSRYLLPRFLDGEDVTQLEFEAEVSGFAELLRTTFRGFPVRRNIFKSLC